MPKNKQKRLSKFYKRGKTDADFTDQRGFIKIPVKKNQRKSA